VIFVVKDCSIVQRGTHEELLAAQGVYANLYGMQEEPQQELPEEKSAD
jgi:ATP-binding cassette subfamily B protein